MFATRNMAPACMAEFALRNCTSLVEITSPFGDLYEILDLDIGLGHCWPVFDILLNFGFGEVVQSTKMVHPLQAANKDAPTGNFSIMEQENNMKVQSQLPSYYRVSSPWINIVPSSNMIFSSIPPSLPLNSSKGVVINEMLPAQSVVIPSVS